MNILDSKLSGSKVQVLWIALPLAALFLSGCPIYTDDGHGAACTRDTDCPSGQSCVSGTCHTTTVGCTSDRSCGTGMHCVAMSCVPGTRQCETHGDCDSSFMCDGTSCDASTNCTSDADCVGSPAGVGGWCDFRNTCVPHLPGECRTIADCTGTDQCIEGTCTALPTTCQFQYDCPAGTACVNAQCTAVCTNDASCVAGDVCNTSTHFCEPMTDCETSATCMNGERCVDGRCLADCHSGATCPTAGRETSYCGNDQFCHPSWQTSPACTQEGVQAECQTGRLCLSHVCRTPCPDGMTSQTAGDAQCSSIDSTLPHCILDTASSHYLCNASTSSTASCRLSTDCAAGEDCVNAACQ